MRDRVSLLHAQGVRKTVGEWLKWLRLNSGLRLPRQAQQLGIEESVLRDLEEDRAEPSASIALRLADFYRLSERELRIVFGVPRGIDVDPPLLHTRTETATIESMDQVDHIGTAIREGRDRAGLTQQQVAEMIGAYRPDLSDWERGERTPSAVTLLRLARALRLDLNRLARRFSLDKT